MTQSSSPAGQDEILARLNERMNELEQEMAALRGQQPPPAGADLDPEAFEARFAALEAEVRAALEELRAAAGQEAQVSRGALDKALAEFRGQVADLTGELNNRANEAEARLQRAVTAANLLIKGGTT